MPDIYTSEPLHASGFGARLHFPQAAGAAEIVAQLERSPEALETALAAGAGLLVLPGMHEISDDPALLVRLSRLCGSQVENYRETVTRPSLIHPDAPEILVLSNVAPSNRQPPARPEPPLTDAGQLPVQFPHRRGWHTDQSFRRPPPDISLFYAVEPCLKGQGHTLFADGIGAYRALSDEMKASIENLEGLHALLGTGRSEQARKAGEEIKPLLKHQRSQRHPVVRIHPVTGERALYLCEAGQMDWLDGPFVDMEPGTEGDGARLLYALMSHYTDPRFVYAHDWDTGDLVIYDNRCLIHAATWYDEQAHDRIMWRTTVSGHPGPLYAGERPSWIPEDDSIAPTQGLEDVKR